MKKFYLAMLAMALTLSSCNIESLLSGLIDRDDDDDEENYPSWSDDGLSYDDVIAKDPVTIGWHDFGNGVCTYMPESDDYNDFQAFFAFEFDADLCVRGSYNLLFPDARTAEAFFHMMTEDFDDSRSTTRATLFYDFYHLERTISFPFHNGYEYTANRESILECCKFWELTKTYPGAAIHLGESFYDEYGDYHLGTDSLPTQAPWFMNNWDGRVGSFTMSLMGQQFGIELEFVVGTNHHGTYTDYKWTRIFPTDVQAREAFEEMAGDDCNISINGHRVTVTDELIADYYDENEDYGYVAGEDVIELSARFIYFFAYEFTNPLTIF